jgi:hypothetical protein
LCTREQRRATRACTLRPMQYEHNTITFVAWVGNARGLSISERIREPRR